MALPSGSAPKMSTKYDYEQFVGNLVKLKILNNDSILTVSVVVEEPPMEEETQIPEDMQQLPEKEYSEYIVKRGDTLYKIAKETLGDGNRWKEIYYANQDLIDKTAKERFRGRKASGFEEKNGKTKSIVWIFEGQNLIIPLVGTVSNESDDSVRLPAVTNTESDQPEQ
jgi:hypothetical protein